MHQKVCQSKVNTCGANQRSGSQLLLSIMVVMKDVQMASVSRNYIIPCYFRLAKMTWTFAVTTKVCQSDSEGSACSCLTSTNCVFTDKGW